MWLQNFGDLAIKAAVSFCLSFVMLLLTTTVFFASTGQVDYCYVESGALLSDGTRGYYLKGHVPWREDTVVGNYKSINDLDTAMRLLCPQTRK